MPKNQPSPNIKMPPEIAQKYVVMRKVVDERLDKIHALAKLLTLFGSHPDIDSYDEFDATSKCGEMINHHICKIFESMDDGFVSVNEIELELLEMEEKSNEAT